MSPERIMQFMASRQLVRDPLDRAAVVLGERWPTALDSLRLASAADDVVVVGPVACALRGYPGAIPEPRVGLIGRWNQQGPVIDRLMGAGAMQVGFDTAPRGYASREKWLSASGASVSVGWLVAEREHELDHLLAESTAIAIPDAGTPRLPSAVELRDRAASSRWPADNALVPGLDAIVAAERGAAPAPPAAGQIVLDELGAHVDRSLRPEHVVLTVPYRGTLSPEVRRVAAAGFKQLVVRPEEPRTLRAAELDASSTEITVSGAGPSALVDDWLASGDLIAAIALAIDDAYRAASVR